MRRCLSVTLVVSLSAAGWAAGQEKKDGAVQEDRKALEGKWKITSVTMAGKQIPVEKGPPFLEFKGDKFIGLAPGMTYKIDPTKKPKHLDLIVTRDGKEILTRAIYSLEQGGLTIGIPLVPKGKGVENQRPKSFGPGDMERPTMVLKAKRM